MAVIPENRFSRIGLFVVGTALVGGIALALPDADSVPDVVAEAPTPLRSVTETSAESVQSSHDQDRAQSEVDGSADEETMGVTLERIQREGVTAEQIPLYSADQYEETLRQLESLEVKGRAAKTGYSREQFGQKWKDVDRNGCDTRNDILGRDLVDVQVKPGTRNCKVLRGTLNDPYTGTTITFVRGPQTSPKVQIDHVVALADAWQKGAQQLSTNEREAFANDPLNLLAVDGSSNQQKGASDAATWLPKNKSFRCTYVSRQISVKAKYRLWVTQAEKNAMLEILNKCDKPAPPAPPEPAPAPAPSPDPAPSPEPQNLVEVPAPAPQPAPAPEDHGTYYANCKEAKAAGAAPLYEGQPGYRPGLDRDRDGVACER